MSRSKKKGSKEIVLCGKNTVLEALKTSADLEKVYVYENLDNNLLNAVSRLAQTSSVALEYLSREELEKVSKTPSNQGLAALLRGYEPLDHRSALSILDKKQGPRIVAGLDSVSDPQNLGAIIRTCAAAGVDLLILNEARSSSISQTVFRVSQGGMFHLPVCCVPNLVNFIKRLKDKGFWVYGFENITDNVYSRIDYPKDCLLIFGSEGEGLRNLTKKSCDMLVKIPISGPISSLNVSVAAALGIFEVLRQRNTSS